MEYEKQIEIKLDGNNCIININPQENISSKSLNKVSNQNNYSLTNIDDISFSVSITSEENMNSKNNFYAKNNNLKNIINKNNPNYNNNANLINNENNNYLYSNEKSKLEITYQSIFYSDLKSETSNIKTPSLLLNSNKNDEIQSKKDSVVKKLNFDLSNSNSNKNKQQNMNSNCISKTTNNKENNISNIQKEILKNINKINTEIQNINLRKLPSLNKANNNIIKNISKNLNKEYFMHEKIFSCNKNNDKEANNLERIKMNKIKDSIKKEKRKNMDIENKTYLNTNDKMPDINSNIPQMTENCLFKVKSNGNFLLKNKISQEKSKINNQLKLYKCPSKPNISNMKLNNMIKVNPKIEKDLEKENLEIKSNINNNKNKIDTQNDLLEIMKPKSNTVGIALNNKEKEIKKVYPRLTSANSFISASKVSNLKSFNSYNQSAKISRQQNNNINQKNSNYKTPSLLNKQIILYTPQTNSYTCSTSYSAKNNKSPRSRKNFQNKSSDLKLDNKKLLKNLNKDKDPILIKVEAHNSLLKNFFLNPNNFKKQGKSEEEYLITNKNNVSNINDNDKIFEKNCLDESINNKMSLKKFNTDLKIPIKKTNQLGLLTERNFNNNYYNTNSKNNVYQLKYKNPNDLKKLMKKNEFDMELWNSIKK